MPTLDGRDVCNTRRCEDGHSIVAALKRYLGRSSLQDMSCARQHATIDDDNAKCRSVTKAIGLVEKVGSQMIEQEACISYVVTQASRIHVWTQAGQSQN